MHHQSATMPSKDTGPFKHGEKVLVPHTDKHYEAKVSLPLSFSSNAY